MGASRIVAGRGAGAAERQVQVRWAKAAMTDQQEALWRLLGAAAAVVAEECANAGYTVPGVPVPAAEPEPEPPLRW
jgi:hypothetical protein